MYGLPHVSASDKLLEIERLILSRQNPEPRYSWSFLYTGPETFHPNQKLLFLGLNPGVDKNEINTNFIPHFHSGNSFNAYLDQNWGPGTGNAPLQRQIQTLFENIAKELKTDFRALMRETMAANYCPYRSKNWNNLRLNSNIVDLSFTLWASIFSYLKPAVIIIMNKYAYMNVCKILSAEEVLKQPTGWGKSTYAISRYKRGQDDGVIIRIPHLSRYKIFTQDAERYASCKNAITSTVVQSLLKS